MTERMGLLLVLVSPAPGYRDELNAWYDTEHLPERSVLPGFLSALRFEAVDQGPLYAALYDLADLSVLDRPGYRAISGENFSPWTKRVTSLSPTTRIVAEQLHPGRAVIAPCRHIRLLRFGPGASGQLDRIEAGLQENVAARADCRYRLFRCEEPSSGGFLATIEFASPETPPPLDLGAFGSAAECIELSTLYRPYSP